jgi:GLPGLI family protein
MKLIKCILFFYSFLIFSQNNIKNGKVKYDISIIESVDKNKYSPKVYEFINYFSTYKEKSELVFNEKESVFNVINRPQTPNEPSLDMFLNFTKTDGKHYYNKETNEKLLAKESFGENIILDLSNEKISWVITKESKQINGYQCFKAYANVLKIANLNKRSTNKVVAWFCPKIPMNFGPIKYHGLPGLILELETKAIFKYKLVASEIIFNDNSIKLEKELKGKRMSIEEFEKMAQKIYDNRASLFD